MKVRKNDQVIEVSGAWYDLVFDVEQLLARLEVRGSELYYYMSLLSAVDIVGQAEETQGIEMPRVTEGRDCCVLEIVQQSSLWEKKVLVYECWEDRFSCYVVVEGAGDIDRVHFFRGRYASNELGSIPGFDTVYSGCPNFLGKNYFHASEYVSINSGHETFAWGYALSSGPLCFALSRDVQGPWLAVGVAAQEGQYGFQSFEFNHKTDAVEQTWDSIVGTQSFSLAYYGHEQVAGRWQSPQLVFELGPDRYGAIENYVNWLYESKHLTKAKKRVPDWWKKPIFCGWHEQVAEASSRLAQNDLSVQTLEAGPMSMALATQENHRRWLSVLAKHDIKPGTVIIDATWQKARDCNEVDTAKWPDLRGFVDECHANGKRCCCGLRAGAIEINAAWMSA